MEATHDWTPRKKTPPNTACWDCYRNHHRCDGLRPCKRCVDRGKAPSCRDPAPNERIPRKRKRQKSKDRGKTSFTLTKQKGIFFIVDPQSFLSSPPPVVINTETCITPLSSFPTSTSNRYSTALPLDRDELDREIESTPSNREEIQFREPPPVRSVVATQPRFTQQITLPRSRPPSHLTPRQATRITAEFNAPSLEDCMEDLRAETDEITDHHRPAADHREATTSVFESLLVSDDMIHLTESVFTPFGLRDATQVGIIFI